MTAPAASAPDRGDYAAYRDRQAQISRDRSARGRDVGPLPAVEDPRRKARCKSSLRKFCETYFPELFGLAWSKDHLTVIARIEECVSAGGLFALAMPRGSGKTTLSEVAAVWAVCYGHRRFVMLIAATRDKAAELLDEIKSFFEANDLLAADFPEVCHPIRSLEGNPVRANMQTLGGQRTRIGWTKSQVVLPTVAGSAAAGAIVRVAGITGGGIRGAKHATEAADGSVVTLRPDLAIVDDAQTERSAGSLKQTAAREAVVKRAVLGLAGPGKKIACLLPCTVIQKGDLADRLLDRKKSPAWRGEKMKLLYSPPADMKLWDEYARVRAEDLAAGGDGSKATAFYRKHRKAMDAGADPAWPARKKPDELSAVQHAMNLQIDDPAGFAAEYQNEPKDEAAAPADKLTPELVLAKALPGLPRATVPRECTRLTAFIDVQKEVLYYLVAAWDERFGGAVIDYGAYPEQHRYHFTAADPRPSLTEAHPECGEPGSRWYAGLDELTKLVLGRGYPRQDLGDELRVGRCLIDANYGQSTDTVYRFCRGSAFAQVLLPSHGKGYTAGMRPMADEPARPGEAAGLNWRLRPGTGADRGQRVIVETNWWKSFAAARLRARPGAAGCLGLFAPPPGGHRLLAEHLTSEAATVTRNVVQARDVHEWRLGPNRENHWWDCLVGAAVAASVAGLAWSPAAAAGRPEGPDPDAPVSFREMQRRARAERAGAAA